jgi:phosphoenolpyruvate synthase/pyruvate phosphate dikinase
MDNATRSEDFEQTWQVAVYKMLSVDFGVAWPLSAMKENLCSFTDNNWFFTYGEGMGSMYYNKKEMKLAGYWGKRDFLDKKWFKKYIEECKEIYSRAQILFKKYNDKKLRELNDDELYLVVREMGVLLAELYGYFNTSQPQCITELEKDLEVELLKVVSKDNVREIMLELTTPSERTFIDEEEIEWLKICSSEKNSEEVLKKHSEKYGVLGTSDEGNYLNINYYKELLKKSNVLESKKLLKKKLNKPKEIEDKKSSLIKEFGISKKTVELAEILSITGHERFELRLRGWMLLDYWFMNLLLPFLEKSKKVSRDLLGQMTFKELREFLLTGFYDKDVLKERDDFFIIESKNGKISIRYGEDGRNYAERLIPDIDSNISELKGQIAMKGIVKGRAEVLVWGSKEINEQMDKMEKGSILIAGQTRPQLMPAIKKAGAIVTDEGGITSHAAIVSRELGIPCIIGTKIATKVIRNGYELRVDADKGIVKILDKKN